MRHDKIMTTLVITKYEGVRETVRFAKALRAEAQGLRLPCTKGVILQQHREDARSNRAQTETQISGSCPLTRVRAGVMAE
jgi:hypothetical protein